MGAKSAPSAPDYTGAAEQTAASQQEQLRQQTYANRPTQNTPWGTSQWSTGTVIDPATGQPVTTWTQDITLTPAEQAALEAQQRISQGRSELAEGLIGRAGNELSQPFNWDSLPEMGQFNPTAANMGSSGGGGSSYYGQSAGGASVNLSGLPEIDQAEYDPMFAQTYYDRYASILDPQMERADASLQGQLRNQGLTPGTEAYDRALHQLRTQQGEARGRLAQDAVFAGAQEQQNQFGRSLASRNQLAGEQISAAEIAARNRATAASQGIAQAGLGLQRDQLQFQAQAAQANYQNALRQQAINEELLRRGTSINEINALLYGQQVGMPTMPGFMGANQGQGVDYSGAAGQQGAFDLSRYGTALGPVNAAIGASGIAYGG